MPLNFNRKEDGCSAHLRKQMDPTTYDSMNTKKFQTRQEFVSNLTNPKGKKCIIGLDIGYSAVKCFYEKGYFCFPSYVKKLEGSLIASSHDDILYQDLETGVTYLVGKSAQNMVESLDTNDTDGEMFSRKRYGNKNFKILANTAIAVALDSKTDNREVVLQTGLPSSYEKADSPAIIKALARPAHFRMKLNGNNWKEYRIVIEEKNVFVMPQPAGSLYSALIRPDGAYIANAKQMLFSNVLVMDIGFGTFDFYGIKNRAVVCKESIDEIGMRRVLKETSQKIMETMNEEIRVPALNRNLGTGIVVCLDEDTMKSDEKPLAPLLDEANNKVFREAMERAKSVTSAFRGYDYIIVSGGTGEAWLQKITEYLSGMKTVTVMSGNKNDSLPMIYSNARGYYMLRYSLTQK